MNDALDRYAQFMTDLTPETLPRLTDVVSDDVYFKDPFNATHGAKAMQAVFQHMFDTLGHVRFTVKAQGLIGDNAGESGVLYWQFDGQLRNKAWRFEGMSRVTFTSEGKVKSHIDHWDAARDFYEHFPVIGHALRAIRGRIADSASL